MRRVILNVVKNLCIRLLLRERLQDETLRQAQGDNSVTSLS